MLTSIAKIVVIHNAILLYLGIIHRIIPGITSIILVINYTKHPVIRQELPRNQTCLVDLMSLIGIKIERKVFTMKKFMIAFTGLTLIELIGILPILLIVKILVVNNIIPEIYFNAEDIMLFKALLYIIFVGTIFWSMFLAKHILK